VYRRKETPSGGFVIATEAGHDAGNPIHARLAGSPAAVEGNGFKPEITIALDVIRKGEKLSLEQWADSSWKTTRSRLYERRRHTK